MSVNKEYLRNDTAGVLGYNYRVSFTGSHPTEGDARGPQNTMTALVGAASGCSTDWTANTISAGSASPGSSALTGVMVIAVAATTSRGATTSTLNHC